jgi:hypothetical protein
MQDSSAELEECRSRDSARLRFIQLERSIAAAGGRYSPDDVLKRR